MQSNLLEQQPPQQPPPEVARSESGNNTSNDNARAPRQHSDDTSPREPLLTLPAPVPFTGIVVTPPANEAVPQLEWAAAHSSLSPSSSGGASLAVPNTTTRRLASTHSSLSPPPTLTLTRPFTVPDETLANEYNIQPGTRRRSSDLSLPPLPSPTFSELFYLEGEGPRTPMPQIMLTPADGCQSTFWGPADDMLEPMRTASTLCTPTSMFNERPMWQSAVSYHEPGYPDEIAVSVGDNLEVYKQYQDGWILGFNHTTNTKGIFPGGCLNHLVPHAGTDGGGGVGSGKTPSFLTSSSRQDSTSAMSFTSSASKWLYGPPDENPPTNAAAAQDGQPRSRSRSRERTNDSGGGGGTKSSAGGAGSGSAQNSSSRTLRSGEGSSTHQIVEVDAKRAPPSARHLRLVHTWQRVRKPVLVTVLMIVAISLVLGLGLGFGKVRAPSERNATGMMSV
ncbi:hypothetical protein BDZ88DRAFT_144787 [Geranomyces variabilis]|nr:hypothetical protein BDZ88DRAFT_144787 [Geranomyces variabilis]KAJ3143372.1 hypothetical protein HDU90_000132 [Geranomyces variabilis]